MKRRVLDLKEVKEISLNLLIEFKKICEENKLTYYLAFGTLLGAVRHKGFIPWDDDIDVLMPRSDYDKFMKISREIKSDNYGILNYEDDDKYLFPWIKMYDKRTLVEPSILNTGKLLGINIDIFPLDNLRGDTFEENRKYALDFNDRYKKEYVLECMPFSSSKMSKRIIKKILYVVSKLFFKNPQKVMAKFDNELRKNKSEYVSYLFTTTLPPVTLKKEVFAKTEKLLFETEKFDVPKGYDEFLRSLYGDYMELPPVEKRVAPHDFKSYYLEKE